MFSINSHLQEDYSIKIMFMVSILIKQNIHSEITRRDTLRKSSKDCRADRASVNNRIQAEADAAMPKLDSILLFLLVRLLSVMD